MDRIIISRHGESVAAAAGIENGDPRTDGGLTAKGREEAQALGRDLSGDPIDLCVVSQFPRAQQTAEVALTGLDVPVLVDANLNDIRYGALEGVSRERYGAWARDHSLATPLPGGESKIQVTRRLCTAMEALLGRPEGCALVVTHEMLIGDLLNATQGRTPAQEHDDIPYATPYRLRAEDVRRAVIFLHSWLAQNPS